jgi:hypothetical protein
MFRTILQPCRAGVPSRSASLLGGALLLAAAPAAAQSVGGSGYGALVNASGVVQQSSVATLPSGGGYSVGDDIAFGVPNVVQSESLTNVITGGIDTTRASAQASSSVERVVVLNGLIRADIVAAVASSFWNTTGAASDADGSGFTGLVVNGVAFTDDPAPNTRIDLPGVGFAVLNEQATTGDGITSSAITVNMIHVVLQDAITGAQTGEIIVGSASSRVGS